MRGGCFRAVPVLLGVFRFAHCFRSGCFPCFWAAVVVHVFVVDDAGGIETSRANGHAEADPRPDGPPNGRLAPFLAIDLVRFFVFLSASR